MASTIPQKYALHALIVDRQFDVLTDSKNQWFWDRSLGDVFLCAMQVLSERGELGRDAVADAIRKNGWHSTRVSAAMGALAEVVKPCPYDLVSLPGALASAFQDHVVGGLIKVVGDENSTALQRIEAIALAHGELTHVGDSKRAPNLEELVDDFFDRLARGEDTEKRKKSIPMRNVHMMNIFRGRLWPELYIIAAREKFGKTQLMMNMVAESAEQGRRVRVYSHEDTAETFRDKYLSLKTGVPYDRVSSGDLTPEEVTRMKSVMDLYRNVAKNVIIDPKTYSPEELCLSLRREIISDGLGMVCVDYLQRLRYRRNEEVHELSDATKRIADIGKEYLLPIVLLSQVNENREDETGRVTLHIGNLKGSGAPKEDGRQIYLLDGWANRALKRIQCVKNSYGKLYFGGIEFDHATGRIVGTPTWEDGK